MAGEEVVVVDGEKEECEVMVGSDYKIVDILVSSA